MIICNETIATGSLFSQNNHAQEKKIIQKYHSYCPPRLRRGEGTGGESSSKEGVGVRVAWLGSGVMVMASLRVKASLEVIMEVMSDMLKSRPGAGILKQRGCSVPIGLNFYRERAS
jgi:hypothetical protein